MGDILFLAHRVPFPPDRGDKIRGFNILKWLSSRKRVHLVAFADDSRDLTRSNGLQEMACSRRVIWRSKPDFVAALQALFLRRPVSITAFANDSMRHAVNDVLEHHPVDTIYVFSSQMAQYLPDNPRQRVVMDFCDVDSAKFAAYGKTSGGLRGWMMRREAKLLLAHDRSVANHADANLFISEDEGELFRRRTGAERIHAIGNGIDAESFDPGAGFKRIDAAGDMIVFTGQMDYRPNVEAVTWFAESVLPSVRIRFPNVRFAIVGRNPADPVKALASAPGVIVTGEVADVRGWLAAASVVVAPLRQAHGVQNKVLEAMAMARPVVATEGAAQGIDHGDTLRIGKTAGQLADHIIDLLGDPGAARSLGAAARRHVINVYGWDAQLAPLDTLVGIDPPLMHTRSAA